MIEREYQLGSSILINFPIDIIYHSFGCASSSVLITGTLTTC